MLTALTPLVKVANPSRSQWVQGVLAYTLAGAAASLLVGVVLASVGGLTGSTLTSPAAIAICVSVALVAAAGEAGMVPLTVPQLRRSSSRVWALRLGQPRAAAMWGLDIGLFFTTWLTFAGAWWLAAVALASGDPGFAALLLLSFWAGRALSVWLGPWLLPNATVTPWVVEALEPLRGSFRRVHAAAVLLGATALLLGA